MAEDKRRLVRDEAAARIRESILGGEPGFRSGEILSETEIANRLNLTRTPIRQALSHLAGEGLVSIIPRVGTQVCVIRPEEIQAIMALRFAMETLIVVELAKRRPDLSELWAIHEQMVEIASSPTLDTNARRRFSEADMAFHAKMAELVPGFATVSRTVSELVSRCFLYAYRGIQMPDSHKRMNDVIKEHRKILDALNNGRVADARTYLQDHIKGAVLRLAPFAYGYVQNEVPQNLGIQPRKIVARK